MTVYVAQVMSFKFSVPVGANAPEAPVILLVQVKLYVAKSIVPDVIVNVVQLTAPTAVVVPAVLLIVNEPVDFPLHVIVPVVRIETDKPVKVPPLLNVKLFKFRPAPVPAPVHGVVPKLNVLNQLFCINVCVAVPLPVNDKFGLLVIEPPVVLPN